MQGDLGVGQSLGDQASGRRGVQKMSLDNSLTIDEAAKLAKCSYHTLHRAIKKGELAAYKPGKTVLILEKDLAAWFQSKRVHAVIIGRPRRGIAVHGR